MTFINLASLKERIAIGEPLKPAERDFVLGCINGIFEKPRALDEQIGPEAAQQAMILSGEIRPLLHGKPQLVMGAALADLLSLWIAGHVIPGDRTGTDNYRAALMVMHIEQVRKLIPASSAQIGAEELINTPQDIARSDDKH